MGRLRKKAQTKRRLELTPEFMADVVWWRWFVNQERLGTGEWLTAPFFRFVEQEPPRQWFLDASYRLWAGIVRRQVGGGDMVWQKRGAGQWGVGPGWAVIASR